MNMCAWHSHKERERERVCVCGAAITDYYGKQLPSPVTYISTFIHRDNVCVPRISAKRMLIVHID